jgi:methionyl-tRNA synthetase
LQNLGSSLILFTKLENDRIDGVEEIANQRIKAGNAKKAAAKGTKNNPPNQKA